MRVILQIWESLLFASQALRSNLLRTTLSLLGITIGIFAIISVFTMVDSLERTIRKDMSFIGQDVMYIQKFPWSFGRNPNYPWWRYMSRPTNQISEFKFLEKNLENAKAVSLIVSRGSVTAKHLSYSFENASVTGASYGYSQITDLEINQGRYFSPQEIENAQFVAILGADVADELFPLGNAVGQKIKIKGRPFQVIGAMRKEGLNIFGFSARDDQIIFPYKTFGRMYKIGDNGAEPTIAMKGYADDMGLAELQGEVTGIMRTIRSIKPKQEDNFALNRTESFADAITSLFSVINIAGWVIGGFSILVGGFGIANIMFVSVKERTNLIGIQKSLGAQNYFILFQFLFEAVILSLVGGVVGLGLVYLITFIKLGSLEILLSYNNILWGLFIASIVGIMAGIIPAYLASRLNPVEAMRSN